VVVVVQAMWTVWIRAGKAGKKEERGLTRRRWNNRTLKGEAQLGMVASSNLNSGSYCYRTLPPEAALGGRSYRRPIESAGLQRGFGLPWITPSATGRLGGYTGGQRTDGDGVLRGWNFVRLNVAGSEGRSERWLRL
jgi:hypothetical protein